MPTCLKRKIVLNIFLYGLVCCVLFHGFGGGTALAAKSAVKLSKKEKRQTVQHAVAQYHEGNRNAAKSRLEQVEPLFPENYAISYYLGLIYLEEGKRAAAISQWQRYVTMDPKSQNAMKIRKYLTILKREQAGENARKRLAQKAAPVKGAVGGNLIAVTTFENKGYQYFPPLGKGIAALLISDLSQVPELEVVDRIQIQMLLKEMGGGTSGLVDTNTAFEVGKLLGAKYMAAGCLVDLESEKMQITSTVLDTSKKTSVRKQEAEGVLTQFYILEKEAACDIVNDIGKHCDKMPSSFQKVHTKSLSALVAFSWGLEYGDQEKYDKAREMFQKAMEEDPEFELAEQALMATPTSAMLVKPIPQMIANASADGESSDVSGSALVASSRSGISSTKLIVGGLAVVGGGVALAGGGGGGGGGVVGGSGGGTETTLTGTWYGSWQPNSANMTLDIDQETATNSSIQVHSWECMPTGNVTSGTISGQDFNLTIQSSSAGHIYSLEGRCTDNPCVHITGTWQAVTATAPCTDGSGTFSITTEMGDGIIEW